MIDNDKKTIKPSYYGGSFDLIQLCLENNIGFLEGNIMKYVMRWKHKNGLQDLYKARTYLERLIKYVEEKEVEDKNEKFSN